MVSIEFLVGIALGGLLAAAAGFANRTGGLLAEDTYRRFRARIFGRTDTEDNESVLEKVEKIRDEKKRIEERLKEAQTKISDYDKITNSLSSRNISREKLVEHYWEPLHAIILCFTNQKDSEGRKLRFIKQELTARYSLKQLTGDIFIIPPTDVPEELKKKRKARVEIQRLLDEEVYANYPNAKSTICFAARVDLRDVYSRTDHTADDRIPMFRTIDEVLGLEDIFGRDDFSRALASENVNLSDVIEEGSIPFLASDYVSEDELSEIIGHEENIKRKLGEPSLKDIASEIDLGKFAEVLSPYVSGSEEVAASIVEEAKMWCRELYGLQYSDDPSPSLPDPDGGDNEMETVDEAL